MAAPRAGAHIERRFAQKNQLKSAENVALHFRERATLQQAKSMTYLTSTRANCRRWVIPLPLAPYRAVLKLERRVSHEGMVSVAGNLYSVPDTTRRRILDIHVFADGIRIFEDATLVAVHAPLEGRDKTRGDPAAAFDAVAPTPEGRRAHRHPPHRRPGRSPLARLLSGRRPSACRPGGAQ